MFTIKLDGDGEDPELPTPQEKNPIRTVWK